MHLVSILFCLTLSGIDMFRFRFRVCFLRYTGMCFVKLVGRTGKNVKENMLNEKHGK